MNNDFFVRFDPSSFHINHDLAPLIRMITVMSLRLSEKARQRLAWMDSFRECGNASQVCRHFSIPRRTFWRWKKRFDPFDLKTLSDRSRKPKHSPRRTSHQNELRVLHLKQAHPRWGKEKIAFKLRSDGLSISGKTVWCILKRHALIVKYKTRKRKPPKPRVDWALVKLPGDLLQIDTKYVSLHGRRVFQYTLIDVISRWRYVEHHWTQDMATTIKFLERAKTASSFSWHMVQSDNGHEFGKEVSTWCKQQNFKHVFSHKKRPQENGYVERSHRTDEEEFYSLGKIGSTLEELRSNFSLYLKMYNEDRPHWGLAGSTPTQYLANYSLKELCHMS